MTRQFLTEHGTPSAGSPIVLVSLVCQPPYVQSSATLGVSLERVSLDRGDAIKMRVAARNDSRVSILGMRCELVEEAEWTVRGKRSYSRTVLQSVDVPRFELDACLIKADDLDSHGLSRSRKRVGKAAQQQISRVLQAGGGRPLQILTIPHEALHGLDDETPYIRLGELKTYVEVQLVMSTLRAWPSCRQRITVTPGQLTSGEGAGNESADSEHAGNEGEDSEDAIKAEEPIAVAVAETSAYIVPAHLVETFVLTSDAYVTPVHLVETFVLIGDGDVSSSLGCQI